jgi:aldose 1-epimerase
MFMTKTIIAFSILTLIIIFASSQSNNKDQAMVEKKSFGKLVDGAEVFSYTLKNAKGMEAKIITYGAAVVSLTAPDRIGKFADVILGYDNIEGYVADKAYLGAIVGRYGNRIGKGKFTLEGKEYHVSINDGENTLHGGIQGFNKKIWSVTGYESTNKGSSLTLKYISADGEEGFPGKVELTVVYTLTNENALSINYTGTTDKTTILNPTNHTYFNLTADPNNTVLDHELMIDADSFTPVDSKLITTGKIESVTNTPMDFRKAKKIGKDIEADFDQLKLGGGYDHNWVLNKHKEEVSKCAEVYEPKSGRVMDVYTNEPGVQFYSANFLNGVKGKNGVIYNKRTALCLETQCYPDSPNKPEWPSVVLTPDKVYHQTTIYKFSSK